MTEVMFDDARSVWELIDRRADASPDRVMLFDGDRVTTFAQYREMVLAAAAGYRDLGVETDSNVSWQLPTWTESAVLVGALCRLGAVQNPMLPIYRYREVSFIAKQTHCSLLVTPSEWNRFDYAALAQQVAGEQPGMRTLVADHHNPTGDPSTLAPPAPPTDDPAADPVRWIFYTSGTTAEPKGAQHTDRSVMAAAIGYAKKTHVVADDIALVAFPFTHVGGIIIGVFTPLLSGSAAVLMEAWTAAASTELIAQHRVTLGNGAPAIHAALLAEAKANPDAYRTIRDFPSGGSSKPPALHYDLMEAVPTSVGMTAGYGLTEMPILSQTDIDAPDESKRDGEGTPNEGVVIKLVDRDLNEVAEGAEGELVAKGPSLMRGYVDSSLDAVAFTPDGFFRTGDLARFDPHGAVVITGRLKDIIIRKGENVSAKEVEDVLFGHPKIADVAVLGLADEDRGEMVCACVVPTDAADPPTLTEIFQFCKDGGLMTQKIPERLEILEVMPRNPSGKVPKHELRATLLAHG
ncbi:MAG: cyclohexanecarboxylate-CoA ligase [Actinomycetota bacterium]|nr:cyclohexanecarboxylate-CoA ligase [Actinomycetota bacterium]